MILTAQTTRQSVTFELDNPSLQRRVGDPELALRFHSEQTNTSVEISLDADRVRLLKSAIAAWEMEEAPRLWAAGKHPNP